MRCWNRPQIRDGSQCAAPIWRRRGEGQMLLRTDDGSGRGAMRMAALLMCSAVCSAVLFSIGLFAQDAGRGAAPPAGRGRGAAATPGQQPIEETGFRQIFDGSSLEGWDCDPD